MSFEELRRLPFLPNRHRIELAAASLWERARGLDYSMPDRMYDRGRGDHAMYYASPRRIVRELFDRVDVGRFDRFLDVGCGKGFVLREAKDYGFAKVGGLEYDERLCATCEKNLRRLGLAGSVALERADARAFGGYGGYDVFYFFNPFVESTMRSVIRRIGEQCRGREIVLIYYRPRYAAAVEDSGWFCREAVLHDDEKDYMAYVYRGSIPA